MELTLGKPRAVLDLVLREYRNIPGLGRLYWDEAVRRVSERATASMEEAESVVRAALSRTVVDRVFG